MLRNSLWVSLVLFVVFFTLHLIVCLSPSKCTSDGYFKDLECFKSTAHATFFEKSLDSSWKGDLFIPEEIGKEKSFPALYQEVFDRHLEQHRVNADNLTLFMQLLVSLLIIGLLILLYRPDFLSIPIIGLNLPINLLFPAVIVGLVYFWLQFGLSLNAGIDSRLVLHYMLEYKEQLNDYKVDYKFSMRNILVDKAVLDTWCQYYFELYGEKDNDFNFLSALTTLGLFGVYCTFWGLVHGICLILLAEFYEIKRGILKQVFYIIVLLLFVLSHFAFLIEFPFASVTIAWVWFIVSLLILWWYLSGREMAIEYSKTHQGIFSNSSDN